jgi:general secretion pathway protein F
MKACHGSSKMPLWLVVTMGAVVMLIVLAVMLPIIQLNQFVR